jgi:hypothetical protein
MRDVREWMTQRLRTSPRQTKVGRAMRRVVLCVIATSKLPLREAFACWSEVMAVKRSTEGLWAVQELGAAQTRARAWHTCTCVKHVHVLATAVNGEAVCWHHITTLNSTGQQKWIAYKPRSQTRPAGARSPAPGEANRVTAQWFNKSAGRTGRRHKCVRRWVRAGGSRMVRVHVRPSLNLASRWTKC